MRLHLEVQPFTSSVFTCTIYPIYSTVYSSLPSSAALNINFVPAETSPSTFLVKITVSENDVVISPVLFFAIIITATMSEIIAIPKAVYKA